MEVIPISNSLIANYNATLRGYFYYSTSSSILKHLPQFKPSIIMTETPLKCLISVLDSKYTAVCSADAVVFLQVSSQDLLHMLVHIFHISTCIIACGRHILLQNV